MHVQKAKTKYRRMRKIEEGSRARSMGEIAVPFASKATEEEGLNRIGTPD